MIFFPRHPWKVGSIKGLLKKVHAMHHQEKENSEGLKKKKRFEMSEALPFLRLLIVLKTPPSQNARRGADAHKPPDQSWPRGKPSETSALSHLVIRISPHLLHVALDVPGMGSAFRKDGSQLLSDHPGPFGV